MSILAQLQHIILLCMLSSIVFTTATEDDLSGVEFPEDILIGRSELTDNANQWARQEDHYRITLMPVEGNSSNFIYEQSGYFVGFQWYNEMYTDYYRSIKWQLYSRQTRAIFGSREAAFAGDYTLLNQTEWIDAKKGFNYYLFEEPIKMDMVNGNKEFIIGFMTNKFTDTPILHDFCTEYKPVIYATTRNLPEPGQTVTFPLQTDTMENCNSYSFQGIFLPTDKASYTHGKCDMFVAKYDEGTRIRRYGDQVINDAYHSKPSCIIVRAEKPSHSLEITTIDFNLPYSTDCVDAHLQVGDESSLSDYADYSLWGTYCGDRSDIFDSEHKNSPYLDINWNVNSGYNDYYTGFEFKVVSRDDYYVWIVAVIIGSIIGAVVLFSVIGCLICICCGCCCIGRKTNKGTVIAPPTGTTAPNQGNNANVFSTQNAGYIPPYPVQQLAPPQQQPYMPSAAAPPAYEEVYKQAPTATVENQNEIEAKKTDL